MKLSCLSVFLVIVTCCSTLPGQHGPRHGPADAGGGPGFRGGRHDPAFDQDRRIFQVLLSSGDRIERQVTLLENGVETLTESKDREVASLIKQHVTAMHRRLKEGRPIHLRDPLFRELFRNADKIEMRYEKTENGVRVTETSDDPYVARLLHSHAKVVSLFIKHGHAEVRRNHPLPKE